MNAILDTVLSSPSLQVLERRVGVIGQDTFEAVLGLLFPVRTAQTAGLLLLLQFLPSVINRYCKDRDRRKACNSKHCFDVLLLVHCLFDYAFSTLSLLSPFEWPSRLSLMCKQEGWLLNLGAN